MRHFSFPPLRFFMAAAGLFCVNQAQSQSTLEEIQVLFSTNCAFSSCHDATSPAAGLNLTGSTTDIYNALVNVNPTNPAAVAKGYKRVDPGFPENSFLLHKVGRDSWDDDYGLVAGEGGQMPTSDDLESEEIELLRQWILYGAPATTQVVNPDVLADFYVAGLGLEGVTPPPAPAAGEGTQIRLGPFFLAPGQEVEYFYKRPVSFDGQVEVTRTELFFNEISHHFILYRYPSAGAASAYRFGLREILEPGAAPDADVSIVAAWQDAYDIALPEGAAYFWQDSEILDMNFHLYNANMDSVLPCDVYVNIYTRPRDASQPTVEMFSQIIPIDILEAISGTGFVGQSLIVPGDGAEYTFTDDLVFPIPDAPTWHLWYLSSHTHSRGVDYDIYNRATGEQIFEGFFDIDYTFNQGFYDWEHPPVRIFEDLYPVNMGLLGGLRHTAKYINNTGSTILWGDRTTDEMMLFFIQYTNEPLPEISAIGETAPEPLQQISLFPNPSRGQAELSFQLPESADVSVQVFDALGRLVSVPLQGMLPAGQHNAVLNPTNHPAGMYTVVLQANGSQAIRKWLLAD